MGLSVSVNPPRTPVTENSMGLKVAALPNVCKMPGPPAMANVSAPPMVSK